MEEPILGFRKVESQARNASIKHIKSTMAADGKLSEDPPIFDRVIDA